MSAQKCAQTGWDHQKLLDEEFDVEPNEDEGTLKITEKNCRKKLRESFHKKQMKEAAFKAAESILQGIELSASIYQHLSFV